jgi:mRNA-degrading endonuclease RelE of RelBE toxin-antitoxin system
VEQNVSRQFLYTNPELRKEIDKLRGEQRNTHSRTVVEERASDASVRKRLRAALGDNQRLREENARLREELAVAHGTVRELQLARRTGRVVH